MFENFSSVKPTPRVALDHRNIVLCGSMAFYGTMLQLRDDLGLMGIPIVVPDSEDDVTAALEPEQYELFKRKVSLAHMRRVRHRSTFGVLVVNFDKHNIRDYIGPSTFVEIGMAAAFSKKVYLIGNYPSACADELSAWGAVPLQGDLAKLAQDYVLLTASTRQKSLFEIV